MSNCWWARLAACGMAVVMFLILCGLVGVNWYVRVFAGAGGVGGRELGEVAKGVVKELRRPVEGRMNLVVLGADAEQRLNGGVLTDTILVVSADGARGKVSLVSIPRDVWLSDWKTKINAIYYYGEKSGEGGGKFISREVEKVTGLKSDYWILVNFNLLKNLVDVVGGIEVEVPRGFVDEKFPIPEGKVERKGPSPSVYETVRFEKGGQKMDGETILKYVRSRQSEEVGEGGDMARGRRQQQVVEAIARRFTNPRVLLDPEKMGRLYGAWRNEVKTNLIGGEIATVLGGVWGRNVSIENVVLPTGGEEAVLVNPPVRKYGQWVWEPKGGDWKVVREYVQSQLENPNILVY